MPAPAPNADDRAAIHQLYARWFGAMERGQVEPLLELLDPDFLLKGPAGAPVRGRDEARAALEAFHEAYTERVEHRVEEVDVAGSGCGRGSPSVRC